MNPPNSQRIEIHGGGIGTISDEQVEQRALELAKMDGRSAAHERDRNQARRELTAPTPAAGSPSEEIESLKPWDAAPASLGAHAARQLLDDEVSAGETLIQEGLDEADHDTRVAATHRAE